MNHNGRWRLDFLSHLAFRSVLFVDEHERINSANVSNDAILWPVGRFVYPIFIFTGYITHVEY